MKRKNVNKLLATALTVTMAAGVVGCGSEPAPTTNPEADKPAETQAAPAETTQAAAEEEEDEAWKPLTDANGNVYDLGGMEIQVVDWWSTGEETEPTNAYEEARKEYRDWIQDTYNFKIVEKAGEADWGGVPEQFVTYASAPDDGQNLIFVLRSDGSIVNGMYNGLMKDLSKLDCLDFTDKKWQGGVHELFSIGDSIYAMYALTPEPRTGVFFHKNLLQDAGIDPNSIYDLVKSGDWTFAKCEEMLEKVQKTDNAGNIVVAGTTNNNGNVYKQAAFSNGGSFVKKGANGEFVYALEDDNTIEGLNWANDILGKYGLVTPEGAEWNYYITAFQNGDAAFCFDDAYNASGNFKDIEDLGYAPFPKGPQASDFTNVWSNNPVVIPGCYSDEKAWNLAFAYNLYTAPIPGYEDYEGWKSGYYDSFKDLESVDITCAMLVEKGTVNLADVIPNLDQGADFLWKLNPSTTPAAVAEETRSVWQPVIDAANNK